MSIDKEPDNARYKQFQEKKGVQTGDTPRLKAALWESMVVQDRDNLPSNSYCEGPFRPVSSLNDGHLPAHIASRPIKDLVRVAVISSGVIVRMSVASIVRV